VSRKNAGVAIEGAPDNVFVVLKIWQNFHAGDGD
jgi:hypothetical protein